MNKFIYKQGYTALVIKSVCCLMHLCVACWLLNVKKLHYPLFVSYILFALEWIDCTEWLSPALSIIISPRVRTEANITWCRLSSLSSTSSSRRQSAFLLSG